MGSQSRSGKEKDEGMQIDYSIDLCIPLKKPIRVNPKKVMKGFKKRWGVKVAFEQYPKLSIPERGSYLLTNGKNCLVVSNSTEPLAKEMVELFLSGLGIRDEERNALTANKGCILLQALDMNDRTLDRAILASQSLFLFLNDTNSLGYASKSGQLYRPVRGLKKFSQVSAIGPFELLLVLTTVHSLSELNWMHTHGMDQFGVPDIEIWYDEEEEREYFQGLLGYAATYCIENGPILKVGDTMGNAADGIDFRVKQAVEKTDHSYGRFGGIQLAKE